MGVSLEVVMTVKDVYSSKNEHNHVEAYTRRHKM